MAKKVAPRMGETGKLNWINQICDTCRYSKWVTDDHRHFDLKGKPICLRCPNHKYYIVRGHRACDKWKQKQQDSLQNDICSEKNHGDIKKVSKQND